MNFIRTEKKHGTMVPCSELYQKWWFVTIILCTYGFFKEMRPSEPFLTESLTKYNNVTKDEVSGAIYPVWTYSYLALLVVVFLFTDLVRYKPMIIFEACSYIATWSLLIWGSGVWQMQLMEFFYGIATSTEVAYYTYIYARVDETHYQRVTGFVRAAILLGRCMSGVLAQSFVSSGTLNFYQLNYLSFCSVSVAFVVALALPTVNRSFYFNRTLSEEHGHRSDEPIAHVSGSRSTDERTEDNDPQSEQTRTRRADSPTARDDTHDEVGSAHPTSWPTKWRQAARFLFEDFVTSYSTPSVVSWSVFWALATCGYYQVGNYIQPLWEAIAPWEDFESEGALYNGIVEACSTILGASSALLVGHLQFNWKFLGEPTLAVLSFVCGGLLLAASLTAYIAVAYVTYALFRVIYQMSVTICSFQVARQIPPGCFGLVFGINTFMALLLQTILTLVVADKNGFNLKSRPQFQVYGGYFINLGVLYVILVGCAILRQGWAHWRQQPVWIQDTERRGRDSM